MINCVYATFRDVGVDGLGGKYDLLLAYKKQAGISDYVLLNTCNRVELYSTETIACAGFRRAEDIEAVRQLYRIACGLDSMILGETEILGQVKNAYRNALSEGHCSYELSRVFESACRLGRKARAETRISEGKTSIASIAVEHVLSQRKHHIGEVLVIGSGLIGSKIACALKNKGIKQIFLANRRRERAEKLAKKVNGVVVDYSRLNDLLERVSVVFTATSAPHVIIRPETVPKGKRLLFVDLGVPYDVSNGVEKLGGVEVVRLNHFKDIAERNNLKKKHEATKVEEIIEEGIRAYDEVKQVKKAV